MSERARAWVDGPPTDEMRRIRDEAVARLCPTSGRWCASPQNIEELARAAFESGWDAAVVRSIAEDRHLQHQNAPPADQVETMREIVTTPNQED